MYTYMCNTEMCSRLVAVWCDIVKLGNGCLHVQTPRSANIHVHEACSGQCTVYCTHKLLSQQKL